MKTVANIIETLSVVLDAQVEVGAEPWRKGEPGMPHHVQPASCPPSIATGEH